MVVGIEIKYLDNSIVTSANVDEPKYPSKLLKKFITLVNQEVNLGPMGLSSGFFIESKSKHLKFKPQIELQLVAPGQKPAYTVEIHVRPEKFNPLPANWIRLSELAAVDVYAGRTTKDQTTIQISSYPGVARFLSGFLQIEPLESDPDGSLLGQLTTDKRVTALGPFALPRYYVRWQEELKKEFETDDFKFSISERQYEILLKEIKDRLLKDLEK